jgi:hypothetical protein
MACINSPFFYVFIPQAHTSPEAISTSIARGDQNSYRPGAMVACGSRAAAILSRFEEFLYVVTDLHISGFELLIESRESKL